MVRKKDQQTEKQEESIEVYDLKNPLLAITEYVVSSFGVNITREFLIQAANHGVDLIVDHWAAGIFDPIISIHAFSQGLKHISEGKLFIHETTLDLRDDDECLMRRVVNTDGKPRRSSYYPAILVKEMQTFNRYYCMVDINDNIISISTGQGCLIQNVTREEALHMFKHSDGEYDEQLLAFNCVCRARVEEPMVEVKE